MRSPIHLRRRALALMALACLAVVPVAYAATVPNSSGGTPDPNYTYMLVKAGKTSVQAAVGSYCLPVKGNPTESTCHTAPAYPLAGRPTITAKRGQQLTLRLHAPAGYITWRGARIAGGKEVVSADGEALVASRTKKSWTVTLPRTLSSKVTVLGFSVTYLNAYNTYEVGIRVR